MPDSLAKIDSITISSSSKNKQTYHSGFADISWNSDQARVGKNILKVTLYHKEGKEIHTVSVILLSDITPATYNYRVIQQYPHDNNAYTQGLLYHDGILYESTGLEGKSSVRMVNLITGELILKTNLENQFFGEGIALYKNCIYQITYKSQVGFVYDKKTLQLIRRFNYPIKEGWGLTSDNTNLIMSDGSAQLFFLEPEYFTQVDQIEVFDNKGMVTYLNELEYINGKVLANVYGESRIVIINPLNGKITGQINLEKLIPKGFKDDINTVLNGIAYNPRTRHIYITGKNWPVLYELEITPSL
jgi:glutamine cyclotransferase